MLSDREKRRRLAHLDERDRREKVARANAAARRGRAFAVPPELVLSEYARQAKVKAQRVKEPTGAADPQRYKGDERGHLKMRPSWRY